MKRMFCALFALLLFPVSSHAQTPVVESELTPGSADSLIAFFNHPNTTRLTGDARLSAGADVRDIAILGGELTLAAHVTGNIVVINGSIVFEAGARVDGDVHVIGGPEPLRGPM